MGWLYSCIGRFDYICRIEYVRCKAVVAESAVLTVLAVFSVITVLALFSNILCGG